MDFEQKTFSLSVIIIKSFRIKCVKNYQKLSASQLQGSHGHLIMRLIEFGTLI